MKVVISIDKVELHIDEEKNSARVILLGGGKAFTFLVEDASGNMQPVSIAEVEDPEKKGCGCDGPYTCKQHEGDFAFCSNDKCLCHRRA